MVLFDLIYVVVHILVNLYLNDDKNEFFINLIYHCLFHFLIATKCFSALQRVRENLISSKVKLAVARFNNLLDEVVGILVGMNEICCKSIRENDIIIF